jgi:hypothetical protein
LGLGSDLPGSNTEIDVKVLKDVNGCIKELGVEKMSDQDNSGEAHTTTKTTSFSFGFLDVLHVLFFVVFCNLPQSSELSDILILRG